MIDDASRTALLSDGGLVSLWRISLKSRFPPPRKSLGRSSIDDPAFRKRSATRQASAGLVSLVWAGVGWKNPTQLQASRKVGQVLPLTGPPGTTSQGSPSLPWARTIPLPRLCLAIFPPKRSSEKWSANSQEAVLVLFVAFAYRETVSVLRSFDSNYGVLWLPYRLSL
jgi:hypothetical protein